MYTQKQYLLHLEDEYEPFWEVKEEYEHQHLVARLFRLLAGRADLGWIENSNLFSRYYHSSRLYLFSQIHCEGNLQYDLNDLDDAVDHKYDAESGIGALGQERRDDGEQEVDKGKKPCGNDFPIIRFSYLHEVSSHRTC